MNICRSALVTGLMAISSTASLAAADHQIIPLPLKPIVAEAQRSCESKTASGLGYSLLKPSDKAKPGDGDVVLIDYVGYLAASGEVFDQAQRTPLPVAQVVPGFAEGIKLAGKGAVVRLCVPAALGYGAQGSGPIPPGADLVFQVELLDFKSMAEIEEMQKAGAAGSAVPPKSGQQR